MLLEKISRIIERKNNEFGRENESFKYIGSLHHSFRKRELKRITAENRAILKRIQQSSPMYDHTSWEKDRRQQEKLLQNISEYGYSPMRARQKGRRRQRSENLLRNDSGLLIPKFERMGMEMRSETEDNIATAT